MAAAAGNEQGLIRDSYLKILKKYAYNGLDTYCPPIGEGACTAWQRRRFFT